MQKQQTSNSGFTVFLESIERKGFYDNTLGREMALSPETLQVSHSIAIVVKEQDHIEVEVSLKYGVGGSDISEIKLSFVYLVTNLPQIMILNKDTNEVSFDQALLLTILPASFSTARGYYSAMVEGSPLAKYPFPIIKSDFLISSCRIMVN